jgi:HSP20 family molecular chaperone IbpA
VARFEHGVLTVELPVVEQAPPQGRYRITVERLD